MACLIADVGTKSANRGSTRKYRKVVTLTHCDSVSLAKIRVIVAVFEYEIAGYPHFSLQHYT